MVEHTQQTPPMVAASSADKLARLIINGRLNVANQGCQMVCFQTKNPNLGKFSRVLQWKVLVYFMTIWSILRPLEICYGHLAYFSPFWYFVPRKIWQPCSQPKTVHWRSKTWTVIVYLRTIAIIWPRPDGFEQGDQMSLWKETPKV
jgi:hypothetical protein